MTGLSRRLLAVAALLSDGLKVADIGCDHGFLPIYLVESGKAPYCLALEVNRGPLKRAQEHIGERGLSTYIETRLSDGAKELRFLPGDGRGVVSDGKARDAEGNLPAGCLEVEAAVLAGMGGRLMERILRDSLDKFLRMKEIVLQPQSEVYAFRRFLREAGFLVTGEDMVVEEGKFYPMMRAAPGAAGRTGPLERQELYDRFGERLLRDSHPVLRIFLEKEKRLYEGIREKLMQEETAGSRKRLGEVEEELRYIHEGLFTFNE